MVAVVELQANYAMVEVLNRNGTAEIWFTVDGPCLDAYEAKGWREISRSPGPITEWAPPVART